MGCCASSDYPPLPAQARKRVVSEEKKVLVPQEKKWVPNPSNYNSFEKLLKDLKENGLEGAQLMVAIDCTRSNMNSGKNTYPNTSLAENLHYFPRGAAQMGTNFEEGNEGEEGSGEGKESEQIMNPYLLTLYMIAKTIVPLDTDRLIDSYTFGPMRKNADMKQKEYLCTLNDNGKQSEDSEGLIEDYKEYFKSGKPNTVSGGSYTDFTPIIDEAVELYLKTKQFTICLIITDGQITGGYEPEVQRAIVDASQYPIAFICVGVGDGPWTLMKKFDDQLPERKFDNWNFTPFNKVVQDIQKFDPELRGPNFALDCLQETPLQRRQCEKLGYFSPAYKRRVDGIRRQQMIARRAWREEQEKAYY